MAPKHIQDLIDRGALFVINHSGGKDSQAMTAYLQQVIPARLLVIIHAELPGADWPDIPQHIHDTAGRLPYYQVRAAKTFREMVRGRGMWPSSSTRQCTSDLKRDPIDKEVRRICNQDGGPELVVHCIGIRAEESAKRKKLPAFKRYGRQCTSNRTVYHWLPIHDKSTSWVWETIEAAGQAPHWVYNAGMSRLSCIFCVMANRADLKTAARLRPDKLQEIVEDELATGHFFMAPKKGQPGLTLDKWLELPEKESPRRLAGACGSVG